MTGAEFRNGVGSWLGSATGVATVIISLLVLTLGWAVRTEVRINNIIYNEAQFVQINAAANALEIRVRVLENLTTLINERQQNVLEQLRSNATKLDALSVLATSTNEIVRRRQEMYLDGLDKPIDRHPSGR